MGRWQIQLGIEGNDLTGILQRQTSENIWIPKFSRRQGILLKSDRIKYFSPTHQLMDQMKQKPSISLFYNKKKARLLRYNIHLA
ncbi:Hypothetical predicted protein [Octopus vulgaris]|uniref:Uncharacterized protein n=1 Tax=Octopus vulgaris TaxID=6645 RepID=A0AA36BBT0_OCTVU|nr:Hypothetical predicted protein [Octopus vulgaris]